MRWFKRILCIGVIAGSLNLASCTYNTTDTNEVDHEKWLIEQVQQGKMTHEQADQLGKLDK